MADVTISSLPIGTPLGNGLIPFSQGGTTYKTTVSSIFQNRPAFAVTTTLSQIRGPGTVPFNYVRLNVGGGTYDTTNYRYTVPVTGLYQINLFTNYIGSSSPDGASAIHVRRNGIQAGTWLYATAPNANTWMCLAGSEVLSLNTGDLLSVYNTHNGYLDRSTPETNSWWSSFSGYLIG